MKHFLNLLPLFLILSCNQKKFEGIYEFDYEPDSTFKLDSKNIEFYRCSFIQEIRFENEICYIKYNNLGVPMNLSSKFSFQDSIISFENPNFSEFGFGFFEVLPNDNLKLGNCTFRKKELGFELDKIDEKENSDKGELNQNFNSDPKAEEPVKIAPTLTKPATPAPSTGTETAKPKAAAKPAANQAVTTKPSPINGEEKAAVETKKPEPAKTVTAPAKFEAEATTQKAPEKPKIDQRAVMGAGGTAGNGTQPASGGAQGSSNVKGDEGKQKGTVDGRAVMGEGSGNVINSGAGYSLDLAGWDFASRPTINDRVSLRSGRIVFKITIDSVGKVTQAIPLEYDVTNEVLSYYKQVVNQINFKKSGGAAADFSTGKITFIIKVD